MKPRLVDWKLVIPGNTCGKFASRGPNQRASPRIARLRRFGSGLRGLSGIAATPIENHAMPGTDMA